jgi:hypothetical protein
MEEMGVSGSGTVLWDSGTGGTGHLCSGCPCGIAAGSRPAQASPLALC